MTDEEARKGYRFSGEPNVKFDPTSLSGRDALMNAAPQPSPEKRLDWLEADSAAQRTAILKLEREVRWHRATLWVLAPYLAALALAVLT
jgi:hypothetical protein